jgi:hypothetical protein
MQCVDHGSQARLEVRRERIRRLSLVLLLVLLASTLAWKVAVRSGTPSEFNEKWFQLRIAEFLGQERFIVTFAENPGEGQPFMQANAGPCRLLVATSPAMGWNRDLIRRQASTSDDVFVVYRGKVYEEQPTLVTVFDFLRARMLRELGFRSQPPPVLAIIATRACDARRIPWAEISSD